MWLKDFYLLNIYFDIFLLEICVGCVVIIYLRIDDWEV